MSNLLLGQSFFPFHAFIFLYQTHNYVHASCVLWEVAWKKNAAKLVCCNHEGTEEFLFECHLFSACPHLQKVVYWEVKVLGIQRGDSRASYSWFIPLVPIWCSLTIMSFCSMYCLHIFGVFSSHLLQLP